MERIHWLCFVFIGKRWSGSSFPQMEVEGSTENDTLCSGSGQLNDPVVAFKGTRRTGWG